MEVDNKSNYTKRLPISFDADISDDLLTMTFVE